MDALMQTNETTTDALPMLAEDLLNVYSLDEWRTKKWQQSVEDRLDELMQHRAEARAKMHELWAAVERKELENLRLRKEKRDLTAALARAAMPRRPKQGLFHTVPDDE